QYLLIEVEGIDGVVDRRHQCVKQRWMVTGVDPARWVELLDVLHCPNRIGLASIPILRGVTRDTTANMGVLVEVFGHFVPFEGALVLFILLTPILDIGDDWYAMLFGKDL